jgi:hypothetical protein
MFEVVRFLSPAAGAHEPAPAANRPGLRHVGLIVELAERLEGVPG